MKLSQALARVREIGMRFHAAASSSRNAGRSTLTARTVEDHAKAASAHRRAAIRAVTPADRAHHISEAKKHTDQVSRSAAIMERLRAKHGLPSDPTDAAAARKAPKPAPKSAAKARAPEQRNWKQGKKGGRYYIGPGGQKIYEHGGPG